MRKTLKKKKKRNVKKCCFFLRIKKLLGDTIMGYRNTHQKKKYKIETECNKQ